MAGNRHVVSRGKDYLLNSLVGASHNGSSTTGLFTLWLDLAQSLLDLPTMVIPISFPQGYKARVPASASPGRQLGTGTCCPNETARTVTR